MAQAQTMASAGTAVGLSYDDVLGTVQHVINLLETVGPVAINLAKTVMLGVQAATDRDMLGVFKALNVATGEVKEIIAAIKAEFGLE